MRAGRQAGCRRSSYRGLASYVVCVPEAHRHAKSAQKPRRRGNCAIGVGVTLSLASLGGLAGLADTDHQWAWLGGGLASGVVGLTLSGAVVARKRQTNGHALDAMNLYNDSVGSLGASCQTCAIPKPRPAARTDRAFHRPIRRVAVAGS